MDDDDWDFDEESNEYKEYECVGNDLSADVNNGQRVRDLRMLLDIPPETLASMSNMTVTNLLAIEAGMLHLEHDTAVEIATALEVDLSDIWVE